MIFLTINPLLYSKHKIIFIYLFSIAFKYDALRGFTPHKIGH